MKTPLLLVCVLGLAGCTSVTTRVEINAPADKVRAILTDYAAYPGWNPFIVKVDGTVAVGQDVQVTVKPAGKAEITGTTHIVAVEPDRMVWNGRLPVPGIFSGVHTFLLEPDGPDRTVFTNSEKMSGLIIPFFDFKPTAAGFLAMNQALKQRAESR